MTLAYRGRVRRHRAKAVHNAAADRPALIRKTARKHSDPRQVLPVCLVWRMARSYSVPARYVAWK